MKRGFAAALMVSTAWTGLAFAEEGKSDLVVAYATESTTLDPVKFSAGADMYFMVHMFEQLVTIGPDLKPVNWLAEKWELGEENGNPVIDVHLRPGVKFHNGDDLTAEDFEFSFERARDPAVSRWSHLQNAVESFEIVSPLHFRLHFNKADASYLSADINGTLRLWAIPKKYFLEVGEEEFNRRPVGTGPWKFVDRKIKEELVLEKFDDYWNKDAAPEAGKLTIKIIPDDVTRMAAFRTGEVDWVDAVPPAMVKDIQALPGVQTASNLAGNNLFLQLPENIPGSPFQDPRVRRAMAHAIDVDAIVQNVVFGQGRRYAEVGEGTAGYDPELKPLAYDPALARQLLAEAGYPNGFDTPCYNLTTPREPNVKEVGEAMFAYLQMAGIRCRVEGLEYGAWIALGRRADSNRELDGPISWMWGHGVPGDPGQPWAGHVHGYVEGNGYGSYSYTQDAELDRLIEESNLVMDPAARDELLRKIARLKQERATGGLPTYQPLLTVAWNAGKVDYTPWPGAFWRSFQGLSAK